MLLALDLDAFYFFFLGYFFPYFLASFLAFFLGEFFFFPFFRDYDWPSYSFAYIFLFGTNYYSSVSVSEVINICIYSHLKC